MDEGLDLSEVEGLYETAFRCRQELDKMVEAATIHRPHYSGIRLNFSATGR